MATSFVPKTPRTSYIDETSVMNPIFVDPMPKRLGAVAYLNTKPLIYGLDRLSEKNLSLSLELPSKLAVQLEDESLEVALIPVVEYLQHLDHYRVVSDAVIACCGPVWSVRILFRKAPQEVETLAIDEGSRSSVALAKVLFHARFGSIPETIPLPIDADPAASSADAVLVIGDRAMNPTRFRGSFATDWDLGEEWFQETGLPFVFAMWVARLPALATAELAALLETSRDRGCENVEEIVNQHAASYGLTQDACREYLTRFLRFRLGSEECRGLAEFHRRCVALGLVPRHALPPFPMLTHSFNSAR